MEDENQWDQQVDDDDEYWFFKEDPTKLFIKKIEIILKPSAAEEVKRSDDMVYINTEMN